MLTPAPDSLAARSMARGQPAWSHGIHLLWSMWIFITPVFETRGYDLRWLLITLASYPVFVFAYIKCCIAPYRNVRWYALLMLVMAFALMPWYVGSLTYFMFGCIMLGS